MRVDPHQGRFSRADVDKAVPVFTQAGRAMRDAGLRFLYHVHGYEFQQGPDGTLFDALAKQTEPGVVDFQMDVFWVVHGGGNPVELFARYPTGPVHPPEGHEEGHQDWRADGSRPTTPVSRSAKAWSTFRGSCAPPTRPA